MNESCVDGPHKVEIIPVGWIVNDLWILHMPREHRDLPIHLAERRELRPRRRRRR